MRVTLYCNEKSHPVIKYLEEYIQKQSVSYEINLTTDLSASDSGNLLILVSCNQKIKKEYIENFDKTLVIHASNLPLNRGWSPHIWDIIEGGEIITVSLLEADEKIDCGKIWHQTSIEIPKHFLHHEINKALFEVEIELIEWAVKNFEKVIPVPQDPDITPTYRHRRTPEDSELDVSRSISEQFDLIRVCDPDRYPAFFSLHGHTFELRLIRTN